VHEANRPEAILIENNAYQDTLIDWIKLESGDLSMPMQPFTTGANKADELVGLPGLAAEFENQIWVIPTDGLEEDELEEAWSAERQAPSWWAWFAEMRGYPAAALMDTVMACWFAREAVRRRLAPAAMVGDDDKEVQRSRRAAAARPKLAGEAAEPEEWDWRAYDGRGQRRGMVTR
ncbi:MAG: hypothetical protein KJ954_14180, partial [Alphaproteobacteria bacterium]|nr:hypothetical protein [Alphaproteobacteria bacterium]